jgi:Fic family protein
LKKQKSSPFQFKPNRKDLDVSISRIPRLAKRHRTTFGLLEGFLHGILKRLISEDHNTRLTQTDLLTICEIDEDKICEIHCILMKNIEGIQLGGYRNVEIGVKGSKTVFPKNENEIREKMKELVVFIRNGPQEMHVLEFSNLVHLKFVTIHPFKDGNGRTARILMNLINILYGYPLCVISPTI